MTLAEIQQHFEVNRTGEIPIYRQLADKLTAHIRQIPAGSRLPSERQLADALAISRKSVKAALDELAAAGLISRNNRQGVFSAHPAPAAVPESAAAAHPFCFGGYFDGVIARRPLTLLLFENLPFQRIFWERTVARFNDSGSGSTVSLQWLPQEITLEEFPAYVAERQCDMIQMSRCWRAGLELLAPLDCITRSMVQDPRLCFAEAFEDAPAPVFERLFPVYFTYWNLLVNRPLRELAGWQGTRHLQVGELLEAAPRCAPRLPAGSAYTGEPVELILAGGLFANFGYPELESYFRQFYALGAVPGAFPSGRAGTMGTAYAAGRMMLFPGWSNHSCLYQDAVTFPEEKILLHPKPGHFATSGGSFIGISKDSANPAECGEFLRFMLEDAVQQDIFATMNVIPMMRSILPFFRQRHPEYSPAECESFLSLHRGFKFQPLPTLIFAQLTDICRQLCRRRITPEDALQFARGQRICDFAYTEAMRAGAV